jgi:hypothetical protein
LEDNFGVSAAAPAMMMAAPAAKLLLLLKKKLNYSELTDAGANKIM